MIWKFKPGHIVILLLPIILFALSYSFTVFLSNLATGSCTIATWSGTQHSYFSNNEDNYWSKSGRIWFLPADTNKHGYALLGFRVPHYADVAFGGMNDQGLVFDMNAIPTASIRQGTGNEVIQGSFFIPLLEQADTVEDVIRWVQNKDLPLLTSQQAHFADRNGDAIVLGIDPDGNIHITAESEGYLVSTNWNLAFGENAYGRSQDWRYNTAVRIITESGEPSAGTSAGILEATSLPSTLYSYVVDLKTGKTDFYINGDFSRKASLDIFSEISKGAHEYDITRLLQQQNGMAQDWFGIGLAGFLIILVMILTGIISKREKSSVSRNIIIVFLGAIVFAGLGYFVRIPVRILPVYDLVNVTVYISFTAGMIMVAARLFKPWKSILISFSGLVLGELLFSHLTGSSDSILVRFIFVMFSFESAAVVMATLYRKNILVAFSLGVAAMTIIPLPFMSFYYGIILGSLAFLPIYVIAQLVINLISIPVAIVVVLLFKDIETGHLKKRIQNLPHSSAKA